MPSFDIESKIDNHELSNAIDQTNRVITNRYDLKDANANVALQENEIKVSANESFQLDQIIPILKENLSKRKICLLYTSPSPRDISGSRMPSSA